MSPVSREHIRQPSPDDIRAAALATIGSIAPDRDLSAIRAGLPLRDELALGRAGSQITASVARIPVQEGQPVRAGDVLIETSPA